MSSNGHPVFDERILLLTENPEDEDLRVDVVNLTTERLVGFLKIPLGDVLADDGCSLQEQEFILEQMTDVDIRRMAGEDEVTKEKTSDLPTVSLSLVVNHLNHSESVLRSRARRRARNQGRLRGKSEKQEERVRRICKDEEKEQRGKVSSGHFEEDKEEVIMRTADHEGWTNESDHVEGKGDVVEGDRSRENGIQETDEMPFIDEMADNMPVESKEKLSGKEEMGWTSIKNAVLVEKQHKTNDNVNASEVKAKRIQRFEKGNKFELDEAPVGGESDTGVDFNGGPSELSTANASHTNENFQTCVSDSSVEGMKERNDKCKAIKRELLNAGIGVNGDSKHLDGESEKFNGGAILQNGFQLERSFVSQISNRVEVKTNGHCEIDDNCIESRTITQNMENQTKSEMEESGKPFERKRAESMDGRRGEVENWKRTESMVGKEERTKRAEVRSEQLSQVIGGALI